MVALSRGQKIKLEDLKCSAALTLTIQMAKSGMDIDLACFGVAGNCLLSDDRYMVFFNQPASPFNEVRMTDTTSGTVFTVNLAELPATIEKLVFTAAVTGDGAMRALGQSTLCLGEGVFSFSGSDFQTEKAIIIGELYKRDNQWRFNAVGQGFEGGLSALLTHFGGVEDSSGKGDVPVTTNDIPSSPPPAPPKASVNLEKVTGKIQLSKNSKPVIMEKTPQITASISWKSGTDYDVYAQIFTRNGQQVDVATFGAKKTPPLTNYGNGAVVHMGDVGRGGGSTKTEIINIKLNDEILAIVPVAYSAQSNGSGSFRRYQVSMLIDNNAGTAITVTAENANNNDGIYTCVPGMILNTPEGVVIKPLEYYSKPGSEKRPQLYKDGDTIGVKMDAGPVNDYK